VENMKKWTEEEEKYWLGVLFLTTLAGALGALLYVSFLT